jgi:hypothetical protein
MEDNSTLKNNDNDKKETKLPEIQYQKNKKKQQEEQQQQ